MPSDNEHDLYFLFAIAILLRLSLSLPLLPVVPWLLRECVFMVQEAKSSRLGAYCSVGNLAHQYSGIAADLQTCEGQAQRA